MLHLDICLLYRIFALKLDYSVSLSKSFIETQNKREGTKIDYSSITNEPQLERGLFWNKIILQTDKTKRLVISGISKKDSVASLTELNRLIGDFHLDRLNPAYQQIRDSYQNFKSIFTGKYIRHSKIEGWRKKNHEIVRHFDNRFAVSFMPEQKRNIITKYLGLYHKSRVIRKSQNEKFVAGELDKYQGFFNTIENNPLTESQRLACIVNEDNNLVLAGAGSGKTSVIIAKTGYLTLT